MIDDPKDPNEMTTEEAADYLFPPEVVEHLKRAAHEDEEPDLDDNSEN